MNRTNNNSRNTNNNTSRNTGRARPLIIRAGVTRDPRRRYGEGGKVK